MTKCRTRAKVGAMTGAELKGVRLRLGWTQKELARWLEVTDNTVSRWEKGWLKVPRAVELALEGKLERWKGGLKLE